MFWCFSCNRLRRIEETQERILRELRELRRLLVPSGPEVPGIFFIKPNSQEAITVLKMPVSAEPVQGFVTLTVEGRPVSALPNDEFGKPQTVALISSDPLTFTLVRDVPDIQAPADAITGIVPPTVASFKVVATRPPAVTNTPVKASLEILNSDGSVAASLDDTVEIDTNPGAEVVGDLFLAPVIAAPPTPPAPTA